jgi:hypothetical protein
MIGYVSYLILAAEATTNSSSSQGSVIFVAVVGGLTAVVGAYFAYKGQKKASDTTETVATSGTVLEERKQIAEEWKTLREYKDLQLAAARKENEALHAQMRILETTLDERDALVNQLVKTLERTGLDQLIPKSLKTQVDSNNAENTVREQNRIDLP